MNPSQLHLFATYLLLCLGTTCLWLGEPYDIFPYPIVAAAAASAAYILIDRMGLVRLSRLVSNAIALFILVLILRELRQDNSTVLMALAHFLVYLQIAKCFREKSRSDFWLLYTINALQVAISCVINHRMLFGLMLFAYVLLATVTLTLFHLRDHAARLDTGDRALSPRRHRQRVLGPTGLLMARTVGQWSLGLAAALPIFWLVPRTGGSEGRQGGFAPSTLPTRSVTGFSESVELNELSTVMESNDVVLNVWCRDRHGQPAFLPPNVLWRGVVFTTYRHRGWRGTPPAFAHEYHRLDEPPPFGDDQLDLLVEQSRSAGHYLFAPRPVHWVQLQQPELATYCERTESRLFVRGAPELGKRGVAVTTFRLRIGRSSGLTDASQVERISPGYAELTQLVPDHLGRLRQLSEELVSGLAADDTEGKIVAITDYLADVRRFQYSLDLKPVDPTLDPVEDFLFNRKAGHCEYFASSAALLLRAAGVSTRVINGFKGAEFNETGGFFQVPQLLAHCWVEAYDPAARRWITVDPTPGEGRALGLARKRFWLGPFRNLLGVATRVWDRYFLEYSAHDQRGLVATVNPLAAEDLLRGGVERLANMLGRWSGLPSRFLGVLAWMLLAPAVALLALAALKTARTAARRARATWRESKPCDPLHERWLTLLVRRGLARRSSQTPLEFAKVVEQWIAGKDEGAAFAGLPTELAHRFYAVRYGGAPTMADGTLARRVEEFAKTRFGGKGSRARNARPPRSRD